MIYDDTPIVKQIKCAIQYLLNGETYTFTSCHPFDDRQQAISYFKLTVNFDKIICTFSYEKKTET